MLTLKVISLFCVVDGVCAAGEAAIKTTSRASPGLSSLAIVFAQLYICWLVTHPCAVFSKGGSSAGCCKDLQVAQNLCTVNALMRGDGLQDGVQRAESEILMSWDCNPLMRRSIGFKDDMTPHLMYDAVAPIATEKPD